jgi:hypothetical protein
VKPLEGWPVPFRPLREPVRSLVGQWEATMAANPAHLKSSLRNSCEAVEAFFYDHPRVSRPEQVLITDVEDWRLARLANGNAPNTVRTALGALKTFYRWLMYAKDLRLEDPVVVPLPQGKPHPVSPCGVTELHPDLRLESSQE